MQKIDLLIYSAPVVIFLIGCLFTFFLKNKQYNMVKDFTVKEISNISKFQANHALVVVAILTLLLAIPCYGLYTPANQVDTKCKIELREVRKDFSDYKQKIKEATSLTRTGS